MAGALAAAVLELWTCRAVAAGESYIVRFVGYAYDVRTDAPLYSEEHRAVVEDGEMVVARVEYRDPDGRLIAEKDLDFRRDLLAPQFRLHDLRTGQEEGARLRAGLLEAFQRRGEDRPEHARRLPMEGLVVVDAGLERLILENWASLESGQPQVFRLLLPSRLDFLDLELTCQGEGQLDSVPTVSFQAEPVGTVMRALMPPLKFTYSAVSRQLLIYEGPASIHDANGLRRHARLVFPAARRQVLPLEDTEGSGSDSARGA